jgi:hypothetical protein
MENSQVITKRIGKMGTSQILAKIEKRAFTETELPIVKELLEKRNYDISEMAIFKTIKVKETTKPSILDEEEDELITNISEELVKEVEAAMDPIIEGNDKAKITRIMPYIIDKQYYELTEAEARKIIAICNETEIVIPKKATEARAEAKKKKTEGPTTTVTKDKAYIPKAGSNSEVILTFIKEHPDFNMNQVAKHFGYRYPVVKRVNDLYLASLK